MARLELIFIKLFLFQRRFHLQNFSGNLRTGLRLGTERREASWVRSREHRAGATPAPPSMNSGTSRRRVSQGKGPAQDNLKLFLFAAHLNVLFKPECTINKKVQDQVLYLSCQVEAFPPNVTYFWYHNEKLISCEYNSDIEYKLDSLSLCTLWL